MEYFRPVCEYCSTVWLHGLTCNRDLSRPFLSLFSSIQTRRPTNSGLLSSLLVVWHSPLGQCPQRPDSGPDGQGEVRIQQLCSPVGMWWTLIANIERRVCAPMKPLASPLLFVCLHCFFLFSLMDHLPHSVKHLSSNAGKLDPRWPAVSITIKRRVLELTLSFGLPEEVAKFLLHVETLAYQEKPDYQHLQELLSSGVSGGLDFSPPTGPTAGPLNESPEMSSSDEVGTPERWSWSIMFTFLLWPQHSQAAVAQILVSTVASLPPQPSAVRAWQVCSWRRNAIRHQFTTITSWPPSGLASALSMAQFEEIDANGTWPMSPIMLWFHLLLIFNFHAKVPASLINTSGHLLAV